MEQRLIDADAAIQWVEENECYTDIFKRIMEGVIDKQPTLDAVPVVRCKECIHRPKMPDNHVDGFDLEFPDHKCPCQCYDDGFYSWYPADDWFSADGERRNRNEKTEIESEKAY